MKIWKYKLGISEIGEVLHTAIPVVFLKISWVTKSKYSHDLETLLPRDRFIQIFQFLQIGITCFLLGLARILNHSLNPPHHQFPV